MGCSAQSHDCHIVWVAAKRLNVLLDPFQRNIHVLETEVQKVLLGRQLGVEAPKDANSVLHADGDKGLLGKGQHRVGVVHARGATVKGAAGDENSDRELALGRRVAGAAPYVDGEAVLRFVVGAENGVFEERDELNSGASEQLARSCVAARCIPGA